MRASGRVRPDCRAQRSRCEARIGSDYCQTHDRPYRELVRDGIEAFADLGGAQQEACLGGTALRFWSFG